ncbi:MAG: DNA-3-methyladenine glycosylase, partial [Bryobacteraceae bacterium]
ADYVSRCRLLLYFAAFRPKLTLAFGITRDHYGVDLTKGPLRVERQHGRPRFDIETTPRIGITHCADLPLRFLIKDNPFVSRG